MTQQRKRRTGPRHQVRRNPHGGTPSRAIPRNAALGAMASSMGNSEMLRRLQAANQRRDDLLAFIVERLRNIRDHQLAELARVDDRSRWFRAVSYRREGYALPEPSRWHDCARLYKQAARALCAGDLSRGAALLREAAAVERATLESVPGFIENKQTSKPAEIPDPEALQQIGSGEGCPVCSLPPDLATADEILACQDDAEPVRTPKAKSHKGWWDAAEDQQPADDESG